LLDAIATRTAGRFGGVVPNVTLTPLYLATRFTELTAR
jgi:hypothetical protein